jgi:hypothetical protein
VSCAVDGIRACAVGPRSHGFGPERKWYLNALILYLFLLCVPGELIDSCDRGIDVIIVSAYIMMGAMPR